MSGLQWATGKNCLQVQFEGLDSQVVAFFATVERRSAVKRCLTVVMQRGRDAS